MSPLACPAATSTSGTAAIVVCPRAASADHASCTVGADSSITPPPTSTPSGASRARTRSVNAANSVTPCGSTVPLVAPDAGPCCAEW
jgi:hypothetical protein